MIAPVEIAFKSPEGPTVWTTSFFEKLKIYAPASGNDELKYKDKPACTKKNITRIKSRVTLAQRTDIR